MSPLRLWLVLLFLADENRYTSLGSTNNTHPNPYLLGPRRNDDEEPTYDPAYMLTDESKERAGRDDQTPQRTPEGPAKVEP